MSAWKTWEDTCAKALGGRRVLGNRGSGVPDSDEDVPFALECKLGFGRYSLRDAWIEQARKNAASSGKPWAIVQRPKYARRAVVTLDFLTFVELAQKAGLVGSVTVEEEDYPLGYVGRPSLESLDPSPTNVEAIERMYPKAEHEGKL